MILAIGSQIMERTHDVTGEIQPIATQLVGEPEDWAGISQVPLNPGTKAQTRDETVGILGTVVPKV